MARSTSPSKCIALASAMSAVLLSSCALPPEEAWHRIQSEGLLPYLTNPELREPAYVHRQGPAARQAPTPVPPPLPLLSSIDKESKSGSTFDAPKTLVAQSVPALPGFVRSPYTNPPRLVDVKGSKAGATMICPYTQRPFVIPSDYSNPPEMMADNEAPAAPQKQVADAPAKPTEKPKAAPKPAGKPSTVASNTKPAPETTPAPTPATKPHEPTPAPKKDTAAAPAATNKSPVQDVPFGLPIPGRPGFVNSPFAAKHQLVDVTGLPSGMEVKCPYTGKLFRVPPSEVASEKPVSPAPGAPDKVEKK